MKLVVEGPHFFGQADETSFFERLRALTNFSSMDGVGRELTIELQDQAFSRQDLSELIAIFYRYKLDMRELAQLSNHMNKATKAWFESGDKSWRGWIFGKGR